MSQCRGSRSGLLVKRLMGDVVDLFIDLFGDAIEGVTVGEVMLDE